MRGAKEAQIVVVLLMILLILGCASNCGYKKTQEQTPLIDTVQLYGEEPYTVQETRVVAEKCIERHYSELNDSSFNMSVGEKEWVDQPPKPGESNNLRRTVKIYNANDEVDAVYLDKVYKYDEKETKRSRTPLMFLVEPKSVRTLYVMWDTQYDPLKDVTMEFTNNTEQLGFRTDIMKMCYNETEKVNITKYKEVATGTTEKIDGYKKKIKIKLDRGC